MRSPLLVLVVLGGCVADADDEPPPVIITPVTDLAVLEPADDSAADDGDVDVCALAAELPFDDICSLICDPSAMAAKMADDGSEPGRCYQLYCALPGDEHVLVGVCLPP